MRFDLASSMLLLVASTTIGVVVSAEKEAVHDNARHSLRSRKRETGSIEAPTEVSAPAEFPIVAREEDEDGDMTLLRLDDEDYWKRQLQRSIDPDRRCSFGIDIGCELKFPGGEEFRDCDNAFLCANDMTQQTFRYIGRGCTIDPGQANNYRCREYINPGNDEVRVVVAFGDFYNAISPSLEGATYGDLRTFLGSRTSLVVDLEDVDPTSFTNSEYQLNNLNRPPANIPRGVDTNQFTYLIYENRGTSGRLLLKSRWQWQCGLTGDRYFLFDEFGNSNIVQFQSTKFGDVRSYQDRGPDALTRTSQVKFTTTLESRCDEKAMVITLDRRLCVKDGNTPFRCEPPPPVGDLSKFCVEEAQFPVGAQCIVDNQDEELAGRNGNPIVLKSDEKITFTDLFFDEIRPRADRTYQYRIPTATVFFDDEGAGFVTNTDTEEEFFFPPGSPALPPLPRGFDITDIELFVRFPKDPNTADDFGVLRTAENAFTCADDINSLVFGYLGRNCASNPPRNVGYRCERLTNNGPGTAERRVYILQGDFYSDIRPGDSITVIRDRIGTNLFNSRSLVNGFNGQFVRPGDEIVAWPKVRPSNQDFSPFLTYIISPSNRNSDVLLRAVWQWNCPMSNSNPLFPAEYSVFDNFGNSQLRQFISTQVGIVGSTDNARTLFSYDLENLTNEIGTVQNLERQLCVRRCDSQSGRFSCGQVTQDNPFSCVEGANLQSECLSTNRPQTQLDPNSKTTFFDRSLSNNQFRINGRLEYRVSLIDTTVEFPNSLAPGSTVTEVDSNEEEIFSFCSSPNPSPTPPSPTPPNPSPTPPSPPGPTPPGPICAGRSEVCRLFDFRRACCAGLRCVQTGPFSPTSLCL